MFNELNNHRKTIREGVNLENMPFKPLKDFKDMELKVDGFFFTQGKYGEQVVIVANGAKINMPARAVEQFKEIMRSEEMLSAVLNGHLCLKGIKEINTRNGTTTAYELTDC